MSFDTWAVFAVAVLVASISPGSNILIVIVNTLRFGYRGAAFTILGNLSALLFVALLAAIGVGTLIKTIPIVYGTLKWVGGAYLI